MSFSAQKNTISQMNNIDLQREILLLKKEKNAVLLAHYLQKLSAFAMIENFNLLHFSKKDVRL